MSDIPTTHPTTTTKLATTAVDTPPLPGAPFATVPAAQLRVGDLIPHPAPDGGHVYVLVARAVLVDGLMQLMVYDSDHPHGAPATYRPADRVMLACRDLIETDDGLAAWTDARWRRAHRRGAAFAMIDQIRARSVGLPPVVVAAGESIEDELDRIRSRDPLSPRVLLAGELADLLAVTPVGAFDLDVAQPAVRAVLALFARVKAAEQADGSWNGADVVSIVAGWFDELGIDPDRPVTELTGRVVTTSRTGPARPRQRTSTPAPRGSPRSIWIGSPTWSARPGSTASSTPRAVGSRCCWPGPRPSSRCGRSRGWCSWGRAGSPGTRPRPGRCGTCGSARIPPT